MSQELAIVDNNLTDNNDRQRQLAELNHAAENASTPSEAREIMLKARTISDLLTQMNAPFDQAREAGKASVVAAHRLGRLLEELPSRNTSRKGLKRGGTLPSDRRLAIQQIGINLNVAKNLVRLARTDGSAFQRYIQQEDIIPSLNGALRVCVPETARKTPTKGGQWHIRRRAKAGVKTPANPSLDEGHSLIVRALGHLASNVSKVGTPRRNHDISMAIDHLYAAEELLKPYRGGYVK